METAYGLQFTVLMPDAIERFEGYNKAVAECQIANCGRIIVDAVYEQPIDNDYDMEEIYKLIKA